MRGKRREREKNNNCQLTSLSATLITGGTPEEEEGPHAPPESFALLVARAGAGAAAAAALPLLFPHAEMPLPAMTVRGGVVV